LRNPYESDIEFIEKPKEASIERIFSASGFIECFVEYPTYKYVMRADMREIFCIFKKRVVMAGDTSL